MNDLAAPKCIYMLGQLKMYLHQTFTGLYISTSILVTFFIFCPITFLSRLLFISNKEKYQRKLDEDFLKKLNEKAFSKFEQDALDAMNIIHLYRIELPLVDEILDTKFYAQVRKLRLTNEGSKNE